MVCNVCQVEKNESEFQKYWHSTQNKFRVRKQCSNCFYLKRKKVKLIEEPIEEEIIPPVEDMEEIEPFVEEVLPPTHKVCSRCEISKPLDQFGIYRNTASTRRARCHNCERIKEKEKYQIRVENRGGSSRIPVKPNKYADALQKQQVFEFLTLLGWNFNEANGKWWKPGVKTEDGVFINIVVPEKAEKVKIKKPRKQRIKTKWHQAWLRKDEVKQLRKEGLTFEKLAILFNTSQPTIREIVYSEDEK